MKHQQDSIQNMKLIYYYEGTFSDVKCHGSSSDCFSSLGSMSTMSYSPLLPPSSSSSSFPLVGEMTRHTQRLLPASRCTRLQGCRHSITDCACTPSCSCMLEVSVTYEHSELRNFNLHHFQTFSKSHLLLGNVVHNCLKR